MDQSPPENLFREAVPIEDFDAIQETRNRINIFNTIFDRPEEKPIVAGLITEFLADPKTPDEVKLEAFETATNLIGSPAEQANNMEVAKVLIDMIRAQENPHLSYRLAAIVSHGLQESYLKRDLAAIIEESDKDDDHTEFINQYREISTDFEAKRAAFLGLRESDEIDPVYKAWAEELLHPNDNLKLFNELCDKETDLVITPKIIEEITDESDGIEKNGLGMQELVFTGNIVRLHPSRLPRLDKIALYEQRLGKPLPVYLVRKIGGEFHSVQFPMSLTERAIELVRRFRNGEISKRDVFDAARSIEEEFLAIMNPEQRQELTNPDINLEFRFGTERGKHQPAALARAI